MITQTMGFLKFFAKLTPSKMINIVLVCLIIYMGWNSHQTKQEYRQEREDFKKKYEQLYIKYDAERDKNNQRQEKLSKDCSEQLQTYVKDTDKNIEKLTKEWETKYGTLLSKYTVLLEKVYLINNEKK